jgi:type III secretory pathway component EscS
MRPKAAVRSVLSRYTREAQRPDVDFMLRFSRLGHDIVATGFLVFAIGESLLVSVAAMDLAASIPSFGGGVGLWAAGLMLISGPRVYPIVPRVLGLLTSILFAVTACRIFAGAEITPLSHPLPFFAYPVLVATLIGWIVTLLRNADTMARPVGVKS